MAVTLRLARMGTKKVPFYRIVATDTRNPRDGRFLETVGTFDPQKPEVKLKQDRLAHWIALGARPSETVAQILRRERKAQAGAPA